MSKTLYDWVLSQRAMTPRSDYGPIWARNTETFEKDFKRFDGNALAMLRNMVQTRRDYTVFGTEDIVESVCLHYIRYLKKVKFDLAGAVEQCPEMSFVEEEFTYQTDYGAVSSDLLRKFCYLDIIQSTFKKLGEKPVIFEIGAGVGSLARVLRSSYPNATYIICDLPETLFYSATYLEVAFPGTVRMVDDENIDDVFLESSKEGCFLMVPSRLRNQLPDIKIDLLVNTASLGEMSNDVCFSWFEFINSRKIASVFLLNRYLNNWHKSGKMGNYSSLLLSQDWGIHEWQIDPEFLKSPYEEMEPNYLILCGEKNVKSTVPEGSVEAHLKAASKGFFIERHFKYTDLMKARFHRPLFMGVDSVFYHFWQACRKDDSAKSIVEYVRFLRAWGPSTKLYEEIFSYLSFLFLRQQETWEPLIKAKRVWLYGAGEYGQLLLEVMNRNGVDVVGVFDGQKTGEWEGFKLTPADQAADHCTETDIVVIASESWPAISGFLKKEGCSASLVTFGNLFDIEDWPMLKEL